MWILRVAPLGLRVVIGRGDDKVDDSNGASTSRMTEFKTMLNTNQMMEREGFLQKTQEWVIKEEMNKLTKSCTREHTLVESIDPLIKRWISSDVYREL